jgi:hypothetical protein
MVWFHSYEFNSGLQSNKALTNGCLTIKQLMLLVSWRPLLRYNHRRHSHHNSHQSTIKKTFILTINPLQSRGTQLLRSRKALAFLLHTELSVGNVGLVEILS